MSDSQISAAHAFWVQVEAKLAQTLDSHADARRRVSAYRSRIERLVDADLIYHQGVDVTVAAVASGGYETNPQQSPTADPWANLLHLRDYSAG